MKLVGLDSRVVCPLSCNNRGNLLSCYHESGKYNYWNCETFKRYLFKQDDSQQAGRRNILNTPNGSTDFSTPKTSPQPSLMPVDTYIEIFENGSLMEQFRKNHSHLYRVLHRALWKNYGGMRT